MFARMQCSYCQPSSLAILLLARWGEREEARGVSGGGGVGGGGVGGVRRGGRGNELIDVHLSLSQCSCCQLSSLAVLSLTRWSGGKMRVGSKGMRERIRGGRLG